MKKRIIASVVFGLVIASFYPVEAQQPAKVRKIGFLLSGTGPSSDPTLFEEFRQAMRHLGYIEGQNIVIEYRSGEAARLTELATELIQEKVEVIVAAGPGAVAAKRATQTIPIVFSYSGDPIEAGFIDGLARPGRNMTGITWLSFELVQLAEFAAKHRLPSMFGRKEFVAAGGLISYGAQLDEIYRRISVHVDKILNGAKPTDVPTELPTKFELLINLNTSKQIGVVIPPNLLARADKVIK